MKRPSKNSVTHKPSASGNESVKKNDAKKSHPKEEEDEDLEEDDFTAADEDDDYEEPKGPTGKDLKNTNLFLEDDDDEDF